MIGIRIPENSDLPERMRKIARWLRLENGDLLERWIKAEEAGLITGGSEQLSLDLGQGETAGADRTTELESRIAELENRIAKLETGAVPVNQSAEVESGSEQGEQSEPEPKPALRDDSEKDEIIAYICQLSSEGLSTRKIAERLTAEGLPTLTGRGNWHFAVVAKLLRAAKE